MWKADKSDENILASALPDYTTDIITEVSHVKHWEAFHCTVIGNHRVIAAVYLKCL